MSIKPKLRYTAELLKEGRISKGGGSGEKEIKGENQSQALIPQKGKKDTIENRVLH